MGMNFVTFNQDYSHMAVGTSAGFRVYYTDPFAKCHETSEGDIALLEMLFSTSLVALVLSPRRLVITNTKRNSTICELTFPTTILGVRLNRKRLVVVLEDQIYLYDISNMKLVHTIDTSPNPHGICALSPSSDHCYLAYPLPQKAVSSNFSTPSHVPPTQSPHLAVTSGHVLLFDALSLQAINVIEAHRAPLSCITVNNAGTRLATASDKGTVIRVFSIPDAHKLFQFRRGSLPARIFSMSFNATSSLLCVSSATETVHVFRLSTQAPSGPTAATRNSQASPESSTTRPDRSRRLSSADHNGRDDEFGATPDLDASQSQMQGSTLHPTKTPSVDERASNGTFAGMIRRTSQTVSKSLAATMGGYLPSAVTEMLEPARDFAWFKLPKAHTSGSSNRSGSSGAGNGAGAGNNGSNTSNRGSTIKSVVAMSSSSPQVMVATSEGQFLVYNLDLEKGGEGTLVKQYSILETDERPGRFTSED